MAPLEDAAYKDGPMMTELVPSGFENNSIAPENDKTFVQGRIRLCYIKVNVFM